jgi:adenylate cyclase
MDGLIGEHGGRIANTAGDSVLAEFPSAVDAVQCAVAVQERLGEVNAAYAEDRRLQFRIGVHLGDVAVRGGDLLGDGVNIAARLEGLAEPGGVCLSEAVHAFVRKALPLTYTDLGEQHVKGLDEPVRAYTVEPAGTLAPTRMESKPLPLPDKPSIAVLPFTNMSGDPEQEYFADGVVEDIITALSRVKWFFVIARNSSFTYKGKAVDVRQVGRELGVRYVLEGSFRKAGTRLRITGQLIEAATGNHIWADRFDGNIDEVFDLQDKITERVVGAIEPTLRAAEIARARAKPTHTLSAYDLYLRALPEVHSGTLAGLETAEALLKQAISRDAEYGEAWGALADCLSRLVARGVQRASLVEEACQAARTGVTLDPNNGTVLATAAWTLSMLAGEHQRATEYAERALTLHPNSAHVRAACGWSLIFAGEPAHARVHFEIARRLSPLDPREFLTLVAMASVSFFDRRFEECVDWTSRVLEQQPTWVPALRYRAAALAHLGRMEEAKAVVERANHIQPSSTLKRMTLYKFRHPWMTELYMGGLRLAGLPE